jgi:hypothetical protein
MKLRALLTFATGFLGALALGWIALPHVLYRSVEQPVQFSHKVHTSEAVGFGCADCHAFSEDGRFAGIPPLEACAGCHEEAIGKTAEERRFVAEFVKKDREVPWLVYSRQPENVYFSHAAHVNLAKIACERCHAEHGKSERLRPLEQNRLSTYSRDVEGPVLARNRVRPAGMKMTDCSGCHHQRGVRESCLTCHK